MRLLVAHDAAYPRPSRRAIVSERAYSDADVEIVAFAINDCHDDGPRDSARRALDALAAGGRLLPEGASMCGHEAQAITGVRHYACHLPVGHNGWHGAPNDPGEPWAHWIENDKTATTGSADE